MKKDTGGPAFPAPDAAKAEFGEHSADHFPGMTLRNYFAAKALQSQLDRLPDFSATVRDYGFDKFAMTVARTSYDIADAMLAARNA
jgi:hypothetical protein